MYLAKVMYKYRTVPKGPQKLQYLKSLGLSQSLNLCLLRTKLTILNTFSTQDSELCSIFCHSFSLSNNVGLHRSALLQLLRSLRQLEAFSQLLLNIGFFLSPLYFQTCLPLVQLQQEQVAFQVKLQIYQQVGYYHSFMDYVKAVSFNSGSLGGSTESEPTQMEMFNFMWLIWDHCLPLTPTRNDWHP